MKNRFLKLKMIYAIIRGRTVVFKAEISPKGLKVSTEKAVIDSCIFNAVEIKNHLGVVEYGQSRL